MYDTRHVWTDHPRLEQYRGRERGDCQSLETTDDDRRQQSIRGRMSLVPSYSGPLHSARRKVTNSTWDRHRIPFDRFEQHFRNPFKSFTSSRRRIKLYDRGRMYRSPLSLSPPFTCLNTSSSSLGIRRSSRINRRIRFNHAPSSSLPIS